MTGAIEPYYYPKTRDGIFKKTLFIAPKTAAVLSNSIGDSFEGAPNFFITEKKAISSLKKEFNNYLDLCRPLMYIFNKENKDKYFSLLSEFEKEQVDALVFNSTLSVLTLPDELIEKIYEKMPLVQKEKSILFLKKRKELFEKNLKNNSFIDIINICDFDKTDDEQLKFNFFDIYSDQDIFYSQDEYILHLKNILYLLNKYNNYSIYITNSRELSGHTLYVKENVGAIVIKSTLPQIVFAINQSNLTATFWDYLNNFLRDLSITNKTKDKSISDLENIIIKLEARKL